jgi:hypothetical protein
MYGVIKNFISAEDVAAVQQYVEDIKFNTKEDHVPLHNDLYESINPNIQLHTRGEMPDHILEIFSKYSKGFYEAVQALHEDQEYHPPMFSKHYIARYDSGVKIGPQSDPGKPEGTYKSYIYWNTDFDGGELGVENAIPEFKPEPGTLVFFEESPKTKHFIREIKAGSLLFSEAWMGKVGQAWMPNVDYENTDWEDWEIKGF